MSVSVGDGGELHVHPARPDGDRTLGETTLRPDGPVDIGVDMQTVWLAARVADLTDDDMLLDTTMHKLGHAFGLDHVPNCVLCYLSLRGLSPHSMVSGRQANRGARSRKDTTNAKTASSTTQARYWVHLTWL